MPDGTQMTMRGLRPAALVHLLDEVAEHLLADVEVGDDAVLQRADGLDVAGRAPDHPLRLGADRERAAVARVDRDHRRLVEHDAAAAHVDERVRGAEVDGHVAADDRRVAGFGHGRTASGDRRTRQATGSAACGASGRPVGRRLEPARPLDRHAGVGAPELLVAVPRCRIGSTQSSGKNSAISRAADSGVGAVHEVLGELDGEVAADRARRRFAWVRRAHQRAHDLPGASGPSTTIATSGLRVMNATRSSKNGLPSCSA